MKLGIGAVMAVLLSVISLNVAQAGSAVGTGLSCADVLAEVYNRDLVQIG